MHCDNQSAICVSKDNMFPETTKHINIRYHFIRDMIEQGNVLIKKFIDVENPAIKCLPMTKLRNCMD